MMNPAAVWAVCILLGSAAGLSAQVKPKLALQGAPYFGGDMALTLSEPTSGGQFAWAALGLDPAPLHALVPTAIGPWAIGTLLRVIPAGFMPANGRLDVLFNVGPVIPSAIGIHLVVHGYVLERLSNPATLPLDLPYFEASAAQVITAPNPEPGEHFGERVAFADLNGDGAQDLVVGCWFASVGGLSHAGRAYVMWGPDFANAVTLESPQPIERGEFAGELGLGDIDSDGQVDLVLGESPGLEPIPPTASAHLYVYWGGRSFSGVAPGWSVSSVGTGPTYALFGRCMAVGDFDDDGAADVAVGRIVAPVSGHTNAGMIEVYWGPTLQSVTTISSPIPATNASFGARLLSSDVSGDGIEDLIVAVPQEDVGGILNLGRIYVFTGPSLTLAHLIENPLPAGPNSRFGNSLAVADLQGDGLIDLVTTDENDHAYIFWAPTFSTFTAIDRPPSIFAQNEDSLSFGYQSTTDDVNGDGWNDLVVNDPFTGPITSCSFNPGGAVFVALGPYFATHHVLFDATPQCMTLFGWSLRTCDLDGDGAVELAIGNQGAAVNGVAGGKVLLLGR